MTPNSPNTPREELEARITALLLGELSAEEADSLRQAIAQDSDLSRLHERLKQAIGLVREKAASPEQENLAPPDAPKLSSERRAALLATFKVVRPKELIGAGRSRFAWRELVAVAAMIVILCLAVAIIAPNFIRARSASQRQPLYVARDEFLGTDVTRAKAVISAGERMVVSGQPANDSDLQAKLDLHSFSMVQNAPATAPAAQPPLLSRPDVPSTPPPERAVKQLAAIALPASAEGRRPSDEALATMPEAYTNRANAATLVQDGRLFMEADRLDEAEVKLRLALKTDPDNRAADYYLQSLLEQRYRNASLQGEEARRRGILPVEQAWAAPATVGNVPAPPTAAGARQADRYSVFLDSATPAPVSAQPTPDLALPHQAPLLLGDHEDRVEFKAGGGIEPITVVTNLSVVGSGFYASTGFPLVQNSAGRGIGGIGGHAANVLQRSEAGITLITPTLEPEPFGGRGDQNATAPTRITGWADGNYRSVPSRSIRTGAKDAREERRLAELPKVESSWDVTGKTTPGESGQKLVEKSHMTEQLADVDTAKRTFLEIALPQAERGEDPEKLRVATGPVVISEINYNDPATGLPVEKQSDVAVAVEEARHRQVVPSPVASAAKTPAPQATSVGKSAEAENRLADPTVGEPARKGSAEMAALTRQVESLRSVRERVAERAMQEKADSLIPKTGIVEIVDRAESESWKKPTVLERVRKAVSGGVERSARIAVQKDATDIQGLGVEAGRSTSFDPYWAQTETEKIQSKSVLNEVATRLKLNQAWAETHGGGSELPGEETYRLLKKKVDARSDPKSGLIDIRVKSDSPDEAARIANTIAEVYRDARSKQYQEMSERGTRALSEEVARLDTSIESARQELERRKKELGAEQDKGSSLEFENADLSQILDRYGELTGRSILRPIKLPATKVTINNPTPLSRDEAIRTLDNILSVNGITMVPQGDPVKGKFIKALVEPQAGTAGTALNTVPNDLLSDSGNYVTHVVQLTNTSPNDVLPALQPFAKAPNSILTIPANGVVVLRDHAENVKRMLEVLAKADAGNKVDEKREDLALARRATAPIPQPEVATTDNAFSTFSLNVSDVSFKLAAASLEKGQMPDPATVRSEEFINAFDYRDPEPQGSAPIAFAWERARYPFAHDRDLLRFSVKTAASGRQPGRPLNLVLLLDNSGSMERADRVRIRQECLRVLAGQLQPQDRISVVAFARTARLWVDGLAGSQAGELSQRVGNLAPEGGTNLEDAMNVAYQTALRHFLANGVNRVVLLTDGAANLGDVEPESLKKKVEAHRKQGVALDCFGIGWDGLNDELLEALSRNGDGRYGFVNTPEAAQSEFAGQLAGALKVAASDVKVQVEWNSRRVTAYRQIGYAKHQLKKEQFRDNTVDAAEIGAAEAGNALYVAHVNPRGEGPLATVRVRFKVPATGDYREHEWAVPYEGTSKPLEQCSPALRLAASASAFSEWLVSSPFAAEVTPDKLLGHLSGVPESFPADPRPKKLEWMIRQAKSVAGK